jgi:hypothetical protein
LSLLFGISNLDYGQIRGCAADGEDWLQYLSILDFEDDMNCDNSNAASVMVKKCLEAKGLMRGIEKGAKRGRSRLRMDGIHLLSSPHASNYH